MLVLRLYSVVVTLRVEPPELTTMIPPLVQVLGLGRWDERRRLLVKSLVFGNVGRCGPLDTLAVSISRPGSSMILALLWLTMMAYLPAVLLQSVCP